MWDRDVSYSMCVATVLPTLHISSHPHKSAAAGPVLGKADDGARVVSDAKSPKRSPLYRLMRPRSAPICAIATLSRERYEKNKIRIFERVLLSLSLLKAWRPRPTNTFRRNLVLRVWI